MQSLDMAVDAAVIKHRLKKAAVFVIPFAIGISLPLAAAILPEERSDFLYHSYEGGGIKISGPSVIIRKNIGESVALSYNYYVDTITSASVDAVTYGSPYIEERTEHDVAIDYLHDKTNISLGFADSKENDYHAKTTFFSISHDMFGDLTTIALSYAEGNDVITRSTDTTFRQTAKRYSYALDWSQIVTKNTILNLSYEAINDEGYLQNPYRGRIEDNGTNLVKKGTEKYPSTRASNAVALRGMYYLPYRAKVYAEVRGFSDTWNIVGGMTQVGYTHPFGRNFVLDMHYRVYSQTKSSFYFDFNTEQDYMSRDKELSTFNSQTWGVGFNYTFIKKPWWVFDKGTLNASLDRIQFNYEDYYDRSDQHTPGLIQSQCRTNCVPYSFSADIFQFYVSLWY